ncbi:MAG: TIGR03618 family F420-dependent PPOX class oxidoreductase [Candidatus Promineifilaceae bacterium]|nr:TIGR03618 family F420-dependent PPOX class oxidoreductase [Candidatus Promineifilaceae bacterium]
MPEEMTADEIRAFLLRDPAPTGKVATVRADGRPHVAPIWYDLDEESIVFTTWHETVKAANLQHDPRVALTVDDETPPFSFVLVEGTAEIEKDADDLLYWTTRIAGRYMGRALAETFGKRNAVEGEWLIRITPEKMIGVRNMADMKPATEEIRVRPLTAEDEEWVSQYIDYRWGSKRMVAHGQLYVPHTLPGFVALRSGSEKEKVGLVTYHLEDDACEIVTLDSDLPGQGVGTALVRAVRQFARDEGCRRLWLVTTNDNLDALRFYQKRGFTLAALRLNAMERARELKPEIPLVGNDGIPLRDEIELEMDL